MNGLEMKFHVTSSIFQRIKEFMLRKDNVIPSCLPCVFRPLKHRIPLVKVVLSPEYESVDLKTL